MPNETADADEGIAQLNRWSLARFERTSPPAREVLGAALHDEYASGAFEFWKVP